MRIRTMKMFDADSAIAGAVAEAVEDAITKPETPTKEKKEPSLNEEGEFFIRRVAEEVTKSIAAILKPADDSEDSDEDDTPRKPRKRKTSEPKAPSVKRSFFPNFFKR